MIYKELISIYITILGCKIKITSSHPSESE